MADGEAERGAEPIRIAIVGTGNIAGVHAKALASVASRTAASGNPPATVVAAADADDDRLMAFCGEFGIRGAYRDLGELLGAAHPDLVHICTPPSAHHGPALACLRAGASVLVEKPPAISLREFDEIATAEGDGAGRRGSRPCSSTGSAPGNSASSRCSS